MGCVVIQDKAVRDAVIEQIVHYGVLDHFVHKRRGLHQPFLGLENVEHTETARPIYFRAEDIDQVDDALQQVGLVVGRGSSGALAPPGGKICGVEHRKGANIGKSQAGGLLSLYGWPSSHHAPFRCRVTGPAAPSRSMPGGRHRRNVFALKNSRLDVTSFDVMDGAVFGFGPTQSGLDHQSGAGPVGVGAVVVVEVAIGVQVPGVVGVVRVRGKRKI